FRDGPVKVARDGAEAERAVSFCRSRIKLNRFLCRLLGGLRTFLEWSKAEDAQPIVVVGDSRVGQRVLRVEFDRVVVALDGARQPRFGVRVPVITAAEVRFECFGVGRAAFRELVTFVAGKLWQQDRSYALR